MKAQIPGEKAAVLGLGISGAASARFLAEKGLDVFATDQGNSENILKNAAALRNLGVEVETGNHMVEKITACDWAVISPGIPPAAPVVQALRQAGKPIFSEIEVAGWFCPTLHLIAVTGSSGKTTVATLLGRVFQKAKGKAVVCGNIGNPFIAEISKLGTSDHVILELSSFQLAHCETFRPQIGLLLNLSPNHQDWHPDMQDYAAAKLRLFQNQQASDVAIIRKQDQEQYFPNYEFRSEILYIKGEDPNRIAVRLASRAMGCPDKIIDNVFETFEGIEHRLEKFLVSGEVTYINDSKCTTTASLAWALEKFPDHSVVLIAGGHPKSDDFAVIEKLIRQKVSKAILIGEARPLLRKAWGRSCDFWETNDFKAAVQKAHEAAKPGDTVLLSPACASFDMFQNYLERGKLFKSLVQEVAFMTQSL